MTSADRAITPDGNPALVPAVEAISRCCCPPVVTAYWLAERFIPRAASAAVALEHRCASCELAPRHHQVDGDAPGAQPLRSPGGSTGPAGFFPVILVVFLLRSFLFEPFKIPSGSMMPTLLVGDLILVNKFTYGIRLPVINKKIIDVSNPQRGDVMVFRYPEGSERSTTSSAWSACRATRSRTCNKQLTINGQPVPDDAAAGLSSTRSACSYSQAVRRRRSATRSTAILINDDAPAVHARRGRLSVSRQLPLQCEGVGMQGAAGPLFHDGRQPRQLSDTRYWGFVPDENKQYATV